MARDFKIELDNVEMINGSDDLLKDTKVTKVTITGENKLNSLNSTFENCTELTIIEGEINLDGVSDMTEMTLNTTLNEIKVTNPTEENIQADNSLNQINNVKIGGTKYTKGGVQDVVGSLDWNAENFIYEDTILENVHTNSSYSEDSKNLTISNTLEQKATSIEITGQTYENLVDGKATKNLLDEMSIQQTEGKPTQFTPHMEQPICLEYIEGQTYQNLVDGRGEETLISEYSLDINDFIPNTFEPPQNQLICLESMEGETYQNLIKGKGEYKLTDSYSATWTESNISIENSPNMIEIPEIWGNTVQGFANCVTTDQIVTSLVNTINTGATDYGDRYVPYNREGHLVVGKANLNISNLSLLTDNCFIKLKPNTTYSYSARKLNSSQLPGLTIYFPTGQLSTTFLHPGSSFTTDSTGKAIIYPNSVQDANVDIKLVEGEYNLTLYPWDYDLNYIQSVGDLYVNGRGEPILDEEGNEQYKLEIFSANNINLVDPNGWIQDPTNSKNLIQTIKLDPNATYTYYGNQSSPQAAWHGVRLIDSNENELKFIYSEHCLIKRINTFTTDSNPNVYLRLYWETSSVNHINTNLLPMLVRGSKVLPYVEGIGNNQSNKTTILMPQPLSRAGYERTSPSNSMDNLNLPIRDKLYYDINTNKFFIQKFVFRDIDLNYSFEKDVSDNNFWKKQVTKPIETTQTYRHVSAIRFSLSSPLSWASIEDSLGKGQIGIIRLPKSSYPTIEDCNAVADNVKPYYSYYKNDTELYYEIIETKILEKPSLDAYSPKTYITTSSEVQPSQMSITNKEVKFIPLSLQPSKSYTIQLDSIGKNNKPITVNLGGATTTIQPTNDTSKHHRVAISTPSELTTDNLDLSGEGVIVNDVMLFEGNTSVIKQDVDYMDGIQSIGEPFESRNLFDYTQSEVGLLDHTNGNISEDNSWKYTTDFIPVEPNTTYCISQTSGSVFNYKIVEYNSSKTYLKGTNWTSSKGTDINRAYNTFTTSANTYYLRLGWQSSIFEIRLEEGTFPTEFMAFDTVRYKLEIQTYDSTWDKL